MPHLRKMVCCSAIKYGGHAEWEFLWRKYKDCKNAAEREKIISALCVARNKDVLERYELLCFNISHPEVKTLVKKLRHFCAVKDYYRGFHSSVEK